jgi:acetyl esterase/lipase
VLLIPAAPTPAAQTPPPSAPAGTPSTPTGVPGIEIRADLEAEASDGAVLPVDAYLPDSGVAHPAIVLVHGGAWTGGDKADVASLAAGLADRGWAVFAVNYRLGVEQLARQARDVRDTVRWVRGNAREFRVDPDAITLLGASAGGHLATLAASQARDERDRVAAVAAWSGIFDLAALVPRAGAPSKNCNQACQELFGAGYLTGLLGCSVEECPRRYRDASPLTHVSETTPPMFLANSTGDAVSPEQARAMAATLRRAGVEAETVIIDGNEHGYDVGARTFDQTIGFLTERRIEEEPSDSGSGVPWVVVAGIALVAIAAIALTVAARVRR